MKTQRLRISTIFLSALVSLGALMTVIPAQAEVSYHLINAKVIGQDLGGGNITGNIISGGLLQGTIAGHITFTGGSGTVALFSDTVTFTNQHGTLTVVVTGAIDVTTGQFNACGQVTAATGKLSGATGHISFSGVENFAAAIFTEDVTGFVKVDLAP
jgi:predicted ribosomally synthesized peptide with SipW-like signal peptide